MKYFLGIFTVVISAGYLYLAFTQPHQEPKQDVVHISLAEQIASSLDLSKPRISQARKEVVRTLINSVAISTFGDKIEQQKYWVALLGVESRYESSAKSSTGAVGIGQLIPAYRNDFGKTCGFSVVDVADLLDDATNLSLSACYFKQLITEANGNIPLAMVAYNAGPSSKSYKDAKQGGSPNTESSAYVTRVVVQKAKSENK